MTTVNNRSVYFTGGVAASRFRGRGYGFAASLVLICWLMVCGPLYAKEQTGDPGVRKEMRFAALPGIYRVVSRKDGRMALELLMRKPSIQKTFPYSVKLDFLDPTLDEDIPDAIRKGGYHYVTLSTIDYYKYRHAVQLDPILIPSKIDEGQEHLLLLVAKGQTLTAIGQREERSLIIESGANGDLSRIWLDTLLADSGFARSEHFFTKISRVSKSSRAVLPVFFKQADACIVTRHALRVIQELNPQIGQQVTSLHQSKGLVRVLICATDRPTPAEIEFLIQNTTHMGQNPESRQTMTLLQMKRFVEIYPQDLAATEALLTRHRETSVKRKRR